jgi:hypothetical protein
VLVAVDDGIRLEDPHIGGADLLVGRLRLATHTTEGAHVTDASAAGGTVTGQESSPSGPVARTLQVTR